MLETSVRLHLLQEIGDAALGLKIEAASGVVALRGELKDSGTRDRAIKAAQATPDVAKVQDLLTVK